LLIQDNRDLWVARNNPCPWRHPASTYHSYSFAPIEFARSRSALPAQYQIAMPRALWRFEHGGHLLTRFSRRSTTPQPPRETSGEGVDAPLALDELVQGLGIRLVYTAAYRMTLDHLLRVRLSALAGSAVHRITAANGSSRSETFNRCNRRARRPPGLPGLRHLPEYQGATRLAVPCCYLLRLIFATKTLSCWMQWERSIYGVACLLRMTPRTTERAVVFPLPDVLHPCVNMTYGRCCSNARWSTVRTIFSISCITSS
jgi:hypothetical protein